MITDNKKNSDVTYRAGETGKNPEINEEPLSFTELSYKLPEEIRLAAEKLAEKLNMLTALLKERPELKIPGAVIEKLTGQSESLRRLAPGKLYEAGICELSAECDRTLKNIKEENLSRGPETVYDEEYYNYLVRETALYEKGLEDNTVERASVFSRRKKKKDDTAYILTRRGNVEQVIFVIIFIIFILHAVSLVVPVLWMIISSFKNPIEYIQADPFAMPMKWLFNNYGAAFNMLNRGDASFFEMIFNSIWWTLITSFLGAFVPSVTGYVLSKYKFFGRNLLFAICIATMIIPIVGSMASNMKTIAYLGLYDNPLYAVIMNLGGFGGSFIVYYGFYNSVSNAYGEAAKIDGAGPYSIFFRINLPQATPIIMTYVITSAITQWNEYMTMILYLPSYPTLASGLFEYQSNAIRSINYPVYYAGLIISMIPTLVLFALFSNKIMTTLSVGGLKG